MNIREDSGGDSGGQLWRGIETVILMEKGEGIEERDISETGRWKLAAALIPSGL